MGSALLIANVLLHVILMAVVISLVFFTYGAQIEKKVVTSQVDNLVTDITADLKAVLTDEQKQLFQRAFSTLTPPDMSKEDEEAAANNRALIKRALIVVGTVFAVGVALVILLAVIFKFSFWDLLAENVIVLLAAAATEFLFLSFFAKNFVSLDPNMVKAEVIRGLQTYAKQG
jgi:hypothetical protein